jgi:hypothetical protein
LSVLIRSIRTVSCSITHEVLLDAFTIVTGELTLGAFTWGVVVLLFTGLLVVDGEFTGAA